MSTLGKLARIAWPIIFLAVAAAAGSTAASTVGLSFRGYGLIQFGMTLEEAEDAAGTPSHRFPNTRDSECEYVDFRQYPDVEFMVESGQITRADLGGRASNVIGIQTGMTLQEVKRRFRQAFITEKGPDADGHYIIFMAPNRKAEIIADEQDGKVTAIRGGLLPSVEYTEPCT